MACFLKIRMEEKKPFPLLFLFISPLPLSSCRVGLSLGAGRKGVSSQPTPQKSGLIRSRDVVICETSSRLREGGGRQGRRRREPKYVRPQAGPNIFPPLLKKGTESLPLFFSQSGTPSVSSSSSSSSSSSPSVAFVAMQSNQLCKILKSSSPFLYFFWVSREENKVSRFERAK